MVTHCDFCETNIQGQTFWVQDLPACATCAEQLWQYHQERDIPLPALLVTDDGIIEYVYGLDPVDIAAARSLFARGIPKGLRWVPCSVELLQACTQGYRYFTGAGQRQ